MQDVIGSGVADWILFFGFVGGCLTVAHDGENAMIKTKDKQRITRWTKQIKVKEVNGQPCHIKGEDNEF